MKLKKPKSDAEDVIPQAEIIEADQYKRSYFGPDVPTLELECWEEELSECQLAAYKTSEDEYKSIQNKLDDIVKETGGEVVYNGDQFTAYQLLGKQPVLKDLERQSAEIIRSRSRSLSVAKEPKPGKRGRPPKRNRDEDKDYSPARSVSPDVKHKKKKKDKEKEKTKEKDTKTKDKTLAPSNIHSVVTNIRPSEATAIGGLSTGANKTTAIVDLTKEDATNKNIADSREVAFNKLQGKTFPSLVVVARPYLRAKDNAPPSDRSALDSKVKSVLMHTPTKFTEWLIQQGLVRTEQWCAVHTANKLKLGMYSDTTKFPYSGGYVWISECCPTRFVSVFCSSIFEGATHPPSVLLKLIYHWACQTNVQNVVQWVKVDNLYVKALFTWLRAVCTSAIHQHVGLLGGSGKKVEVGVISLGTTSHDGTQRQVKVEVLGVLDLSDKTIRLRAVEPLSENEKNYKKRFQKILEPLTTWVHPSSTILTDLTVDKGTLQNMGFKTVHQSSNQTDHSKHSNANIMEYLRRIVPRMFQNTLSLLSRQIIQQFLDELVWREKYGISPGQAFDNIVTHISEQTKAESKDSITTRLNKIAANPFKIWKYPNKKSREEEPPVETGRSKRGRKRKEPTPPPPPTTSKREKKKKATYVPPDDDDDDEEMPLAQRRLKVKQEKDKPKESPAPVGRGRPRKRDITYDENDDVPLKAIKKEQKQEETVSMEQYYFGEFGGKDEVKKIAISVECPICFIEFTNNCEFMRHIHSHIVPAPDGAAAVGSPPQQCLFCLARFSNEETLNTHVKHTHPTDTKTQDLLTYTCLICEVRFAAVLSVASHMQRAHAPLELPYRCESCDYRASSHRRVIQHFYSVHSHSDKVQCPKCLKVFPIYADGHDLASNVNIYIDHLKVHLLNNMEAPCNRCVLKFVHLGQLKEHQIRNHDTVPGATPICAEEHLIAKPKNKPRPPIKDATGFSIARNFEGMTFCTPDGLLCRECDTNLDSDKHFLGVLKCSKCPFVSSCYRAQLAHARVCAGPYSLEDAPRAAPRLAHCVCGYSTVIGTDMLSHLLVCEHTSAYSSPAEARANIAGANTDVTTDVPTDTQNTTTEAPAEETTDDSAPANDSITESAGDVPVPEYAPPSVLNTQLSLDDLAPPSVLPPDTTAEAELAALERGLERGLATPRHDAAPYALPDFEPLPQEPPPQPDFDQL